MEIDIADAIRAYQACFTFAQQQFAASRVKKINRFIKESMLRNARDYARSGIAIRAAFYGDMPSQIRGGLKASAAFTLGLSDGEGGREVTENPFDVTKSDERLSWQNARQLGHILFIAANELPKE